MARVTVEDCIDKTETRFELVLVAAQRARKIGSGAALTIERDNDKNTVVSLREIAQETIGVDEMREELTKSHQRMAALEEEEDTVDLMDGEEEWEKMAQAAALAERGEAAPVEQGGMYADEEVSEPAVKTEGEPSIQDLAGNQEA